MYGRLNTLQKTCRGLLYCPTSAQPVGRGDWAAGEGSRRAQRSGRVPDIWGRPWQMVSHSSYMMRFPSSCV
eukprot:scaffold40154_cov33-Tisochrysis_lutea.AAC.1